MEKDFTQVDKKRLILFALVAYGITFLMMIPMYIGKGMGLDLNQVVTAQMLSPAAAVALGYLIFLKDEKLVPKLFMRVLVINYLIMLATALLSIFAVPFRVSTVYGGQTAGNIYMRILQFSTYFCSLLIWISYFVSRRKKRKFAGLSRRKELKGIILVLIFAVLDILCAAGPVYIKGLFDGLLTSYRNQIGRAFEFVDLKRTVLLLPVSYLVSVAMFIGEEYGWRFYLQPLLQKRFGKRLGIILLGLAWSLWHIPADIFTRSGPSIPQLIVLRVISCVFGGIILGWAYMKTGNIWVTVCMHFLNNTIRPIVDWIISYISNSAPQDSWLSVALAFVVEFLFFGLFIFTKEFREPGKARKR